MKELPKKIRKIITTKPPGKGGVPPGRAFLGQGFLALIIFLSLVSLYSLVSDSSKAVEEVSLSALAQEITVL